MEKLDNVVKQIQLDVLLEYRQALPNPNLEKVANYLGIVRIINSEFDEHYALEISSYEDLAKKPNFHFVSRLPLRE